MPDSIDIAIVILIREDTARPCVLITKRAAGIHLAGRWEFPGGKIEPGEAPQAAARRELAEETGIALPDDLPLERRPLIEHAYPERSVRLHPFIARVGTGSSVPISIGEQPIVDHRWIDPAELETIDFPDANRRIVRDLIGMPARG